MTSPARAAGVRAAFFPETLSVAPGDTFSVQVRIPAAGSAINGYAATIAFDPAVVHFLAQNQAAQEGPLLRDSCFTHNVYYSFSSAADSMSVLDIMLGNGCATVGPGTLLRLRFVAVGPVALTSIRFRRLVFYNDGLYVLPVAHSDATVLIGATLDVPRVSAPPAAMRFWAEPNPSRGACVLRTDRPVQVAREVVVCDVSGRTVRRLAAAALGSGIRAQWDGRDGSGRIVPPGVYAAFVQDGARRLRVSLIRLP